MKILFVSHRVPWPLKDGGVIAMHTLMQGLKNAGAQVKLLCLNPKKDNVSRLQLPHYFFDDFGFEALDIDTDLKPVAAFANLFSSKSYHAVRFENAEFGRLLGKVLQAERFDIIHLESLYVTSYMPVMRQYHKGPVVMRAHNVEHRIWQKLANNESNPVKRWYLGLLARRLAKFELRAFEQLDALVALTHEDADFFYQHGFKGQVLLSPHGIETDRFIPARASGDTDVFHLGSMDWIPNQEAMRWFLDEIWPLVLKEKPGTQFHLAGKKIPQWFYERSDQNVTIAGEVPDALHFMQQHHIMVVPLLSGSGIRVKILEGMALAKPIIATPRAAAGIEFTNGQNILIGETPQEVAQQVITLLSDATRRLALGANARKLVEHRYDNKALCRELLEFYNDLSKK